ncbi:MAG TPA: class I SAM-dependent methyltransferase [Bryobacteraceae bacterium]
MDSSSVGAYEVPARVAAYDADMDLMHPNRHKMVEVIMAVLAASTPEPQLVVDLGTGTGFLLDRLLRDFPNCRAVAIDGSQRMVAAAKSRLGTLAERVEFRIADFRQPDAFGLEANSADAVLSAYALHHLNLEEKAQLLGHCHTLLKDGGWFLNADLVVEENEFLEGLTQQMRVAGIVERAQGRDPRFPDAAATRRFIDELQRSECDQPQKAADDLRTARECGYRHVSLFWKDTREVVYGGIR